MSRWHVPLADVIVGDDDLAEVMETYRSGWLSMGPRTESFEAALARYTGAPHALACANGTAALHLMCLAAGLGPGDEVIVPSLTFVATANAIRYTGASPVFADIASDAEPWLDPEAVARAVTPRTRAVLHMTYGGHAGASAAVRALAAERGLMFLEDAAHGLGSRLQGAHLGTLGQAGAYSFFSNKNLAVGEGGAVVCRDPDFAARVKLLRSHGMTALSWDRQRGHAAGYDVVDLGFNYRIDEPRAALGEARLRRLDAENAQRRVLDARYRELLAPLGVTCALPPAAGLERAVHLFAIVLEPGADRDAFRAALAEAGIQTSVHYAAVHRFAIYAGTPADLPRTDAYAARTVTLPMFAHMTEAQQDRVVAAVAAALAAQRPASPRSSPTP